MNTTEEKKVARTVSDKKLLNGTWKLVYKLTNRLGPGGFSGRLLSSYSDLLTGLPRHLYNEHGDMTPGYFIEKQVTTFEPTNDPVARNILDWLIGHPEVGIEGVQIGASELFMKKKKSNPRIILKNMDHQEITDIQDEDYIDRVVGRIVSVGGPGSLSLEKVRFILSALNMQYFDMKYITDKEVERTKLNKRLKNYARKSVDASKEIERILDNLDNAKYEYEIKEMMRKEIIYIANGMYKYEGNPLGTSLESVVKYFAQNPDFYAELAAELYIRLKSERNY